MASSFCIGFSLACRRWVLSSGSRRYKSKGAMKVEQPFRKSFTIAIVAFVVMAIMITAAGEQKNPQKMGSAFAHCLFPAVLAGLFWSAASFAPKRAEWFWIALTYAVFFVGCAACTGVRHAP
jgi:hypothetical protein